MTTKKAEKKLIYRDILFQMDQFPSCCGIGIIHAFNPEGAVKVEWRERGRTLQDRVTKVEVPCKYATEEEQAEACYSNILSRVGEDGITTLLIALVSEEEGGDRGPWPALRKILNERWQVVRTFTNPNTWNTVTLYCKHFEEAVLERARDDDY